MEKTKEQTKIEALLYDLLKEKEKLDSYINQTDLYKELVQDKYKEQWDDELKGMERKLQEIKNLIPNFSQETCDLYVEYYWAKQKYEHMSGIYSVMVKKREERMKKISLNELYIEEIKNRIECIDQELTQLKIRENANQEQ